MRAISRCASLARRTALAALPAPILLATVSSRSFRSCCRAQGASLSTQVPQPTAPPEPPSDIDLVVTAAAARRLGEVRKTLSSSNPNADRLALRVRVDSGGCSGFKYNFELDFNGPQSDDAVFRRDGATVLVDNASLPLVAGATLNWSEEMMRQAFSIINNPQSDAGCSCGASFTPK